MSNKKGGESVKVVVRCRPMNQKEIAQGHQRIIEMNVKKGTIEINNPAKKEEVPRMFTYDSVYDWNSKQIDLYDETFRQLVDSVLEGYNGTIFAYGQTGTGKTFTMEGVRSDPVLRGVIPNSFEHIFTHIARTQNQQYLVRASYLEIYQEDIRDLLSKDQSRRLELKERPDTGVYVKDLQSFVCKSVKEIEHVMNVGNQNRAVGATNMNEHSSRSHAIFIVTIECSEPGADGENHIRVGKLNMVDLAGSERQTKTGATGERLKEATKINLSLSALGNVISALVDGKSTHVPYRDSKLTRLLQDSLGGNARTVMVANIGPASYNFEETITTLRYANRAKNIKNKPKINEDPKDALLREFQEEILRLKRELEKRGGGGGGSKKVRRRRLKENGETEEIEEEGVEGGEQNGEDKIKLEQARLEEDKKALQENHSMMAEEKEKLMGEIQKKAQQLKKQQEAQTGLKSKIKMMESKLLVGGKSIVDKTTEQERALEEQRIQIAEQQRREREIQQKLDEKEENAVEIKGNYSTLQQEVDSKTKKLKKLFAKLQTTRSEIADLQDAHIRERQELEQAQEDLTKEMKLKSLIIENFIPPDERVKLTNRAVYDEENEEWRLKPSSQNGSQPAMAKRPVSAVGNRRPITEYAKMAAAMGGHMRYKAENIIMIELDMPNRTTREYEGPAVAPKVQAALDAALQDEEDLTLDADILLSKTKVRSKRRDKHDHGERPKTGRRSRGPPSTNHQQGSSDSAQYPTARGLVAQQKRVLPQ
ncbi:kinesin-II 95 kDa subunit-like [Stylophora pistillata]|uniref:Kinesin-like protein n=1 Tax=Stylophora pistillata TaxID=50429 RepID=A0A2B4S523_STYPI|nr:kinesin-II 95 kDa subunit-like [Stylophora pistillata]PFX24486.1 Kinesin-II 95 kDa subunit [Stylophora pistillata]